MTDIPVCVRCTTRPGGYARSLCRPCHQRVTRAGELDRYPPKPTGRATTSTVEATYRQVYHWVSAGYVTPLNPRCGSGSVWQWSPEEHAVLARMARLVRLGITPKTAARLARWELDGSPVVEVLAPLLAATPGRG